MQLNCEDMNIGKQFNKGKFVKNKYIIPYKDFISNELFENGNGEYDL